MEVQAWIGPRMVAYNACLYYAGLLPEEGVGIEVPRNLRLPDRDDGWESSSWRRPSRTPGRRGRIPGTTATGGSSSSAARRWSPSTIPGTVTGPGDRGEFVDRYLRLTRRSSAAMEYVLES